MIKCYLIIILEKIRSLFKGKRSTEKIPYGIYCYEYNCKTKEFNICPYWVYGSSSRMIAGCKYLECVDKGLCLWDQVKECGVNEEV